MKIIIFGATGGTGRHLVSQGLEKGDTITAFVRNSAALAITHKNLSIVQGNILNTTDVEKAIKGKDVVISVLGIKAAIFSKPTTTISDGLKNIIHGMKKNNVKRLLFVSSFGLNKEIFLPEKLLIRMVLKNLFADIPMQEKLIKESGLDWTIVHPARLIHGPKTGNYKIGEQLFIGPFSKISRADVADFLLKNTQSPQYIKKSITISY